MANNVFANGREIACKAAEGKSTCAFPDVCMTPPETPATPAGVPVPYPNTGYAKDTTKGSKTVKISGKPVMLRDQSYFKTSTGNEAGSAAKKGVVTGVNRGKVYFNSWSMNVKIEGKNVVRHLDLTTHNHGSVPGNTGVWRYIDTGVEAGQCERDKRKVEAKCKPKEEADQATGKRKRQGDVDKKPATWKDSACKGLEFKPLDNLDPAAIERKLNEILDVGKQLEDALRKAKDILVEKVETWALEKGGRLIAKSAVKGWLGPLGWVWTAYDVVSAGLEIKDMWGILDEMKEDIETLKQLPKEIEEIKKQGLTPKSLANAQAALARAVPCLRARKCMLVPYEKSRQSKQRGDEDSGCCPGQTPHHLMPKSQFKDAADCPGYNEDKAPCVCVEGTSHSKGGTHQKFHDFIEPEIKRAADAQGEMTYRQAKTIALNSHEKVFGHCSKACLAAQLDNHYKQVCGRPGKGFNENSKVRAASAKSNKVYQNVPQEGAEI
ncbi:PAAR-like domain-containing protein [Candidatus Thiosymbion oneisti]|uniref:PAAR-like domain-containing protein n=1 Tax=Candidatus Thiosymbion oneisti TaxID=589554 RepID=UPI000A9ED613|nr:PAAR-like domain-containing protein [Candidatus Thiosymbion oneisti]